MADATPTPGGPMNLGPMEIGLIVLAILLLFGYKKLPDASRSLGRSLRIFKGAMKGMKEDDVRTRDAATTTPGRGEIVAPAETSASGDLTAQLHEEARVAEARAAEVRARGDPSRTFDGPRGALELNDGERARPGPAAAAPPGTPRSRGEDEPRRPSQRAAQPCRQGAAGPAAGHRGRLLVVRARPRRLHPRPVLRPRPEPALRGQLRQRVRAADHRRVRRRLHPPEGELPGRRGDIRADLAVPTVGVHHPGAQAQREALRNRVRGRLDGAVLPRRRAGLHIAVGRPEAVAGARR